MVSYVYEVPGDFPSLYPEAPNVVYLTRLEEEIFEDMPVGTPVLDSLTRVGDEVIVVFSSALTAPQEASLDNIVSLHPTNFSVEEGDQDPVSDANEPGPTGEQGSTGPIGVTGNAGSTGNTGPDGNDGSAGNTGASGATGSDGLLGPTGSAGSAGTTGSTGAVGPAGNDGSDGVTGSTGPAGTGGEYFYYEDLTDRTTNSTSWKKYTDWDTPVLEGGVYRFGWHFKYNIEGDETARFRIRNGSTTWADHRADTPNEENAEINVSGFTFRTLSAGSINIDLDRKIAEDDSSVKIFEARFELWKVG